MTSEEYGFIFGTPAFIKDWQSAAVTTAAVKLDAEIMGIPIIISPIVPKDEFWLSDGKGNFIKCKVILENDGN